ncbi:MAG: type I DNA topoisomerase [Armatimonadota bacterium]|jgi:DNA topoisomerase-1|nr:type I DNA topoisomerase [Acidobacteriota bacterium]NLN91509.1 type I DNA topoisomerase [candidate division WS1 bacterium]
MARSLVIVESPAKVRTLRNFLGDRYLIEASMGHVRDLPKTVMGVDVERDFEPTYRVLPDKRETLDRLAKAARKADAIILATDPDREGEAIAWHLAEALKVEDPIRIEFNEITESAVKGALASPRRIDMSRVNAQQARRVLDRLVGYRLSPLISKKLRMRGLSAGRVQSVALRLIVDREREIQAFESQEYWSILAELAPQEATLTFGAITPFTRATKMSVTDEAQAQGIVEHVRDKQWVVEKLTHRTIKRRPRPPFMTSTLQQAASSRYGFGAARTMRIAQNLYEGKQIGDEGQVGLITYMRTDSTRVADIAQKAAREFIGQRYGETYLPKKPPQYTQKKGQDAHEAIRPTDITRTPESVARYLEPDELKLYTLIWERFIASQMVEARIEASSADVRAGEYLFRATGSRVAFPGWMAVTKEALADSSEQQKKGQNGDDDEELESDGTQDLPPLEEGQVLDLRKLTPRQHFTQPPPRFTEAALIAELEKLGVGRPSTYAPTVDVIKQREYADLVERRFVPSPLGFAVNDALVGHFAHIVDTRFTARMEEALDSVEEGDEDWRGLLKRFYGDFALSVSTAEESMPDGHIDAGGTCPECGSQLVLRRGRNGLFVACSGYPECRYVQRDNTELTETGEECPECGKPLVRRTGRFGPFVGCSGYPDCRYIKKRKAAEPVSTGVKCPREGCDGEIMRRSSRRGKTFYGCSAYPKCDFVLWNRPVGEACPEDGEPLVYKPPRKGSKGHGTILCSNKECSYRRDADEATAAALTEAAVDPPAEEGS